MNKINNETTGIDWTPELPESWKFRRLGTIGRFFKGGNISRSDLIEEGEGIAAVLYGDIYTKYDIVASRIVSRVSTKATHNAIWLAKGDLLMTGSGETREDIGKCVVFNADEPTCAGGDVIIFKQNIFDPAFLSYSQNSPQAKYQKAISAKGEIIVHTYGSKLRDLVMPFPDIEEQKRIAAFLDLKSAKIAHFVERKERFIELLKEQRQSIITHAVTKGIDPTAKLKPSGIDWLGDIPEHWDVRRLKFISDVRVSSVDKLSHKGEKKVKLCNYVDVYKNEYITDTIDFMEATASESEIERFALEPGDVIITKDSETPADIAVPAFVTEELENVVCGYHLAHIRPHRKMIVGELLFRLFQSKTINSHYETSAKGVTRYGLSYGDIDGVFIPFPKSIDEQKQIVDHIKSETGLLDKTIAKAQREIELMKEYREAMIAEAVTGKMSVS